MPAHVGFDQTGICVHLSGQQSQPQQLPVEAIEYVSEALIADTLDEVADGRVVEHPVVYRQEIEPAKRDALRDGRAQPSVGGDVVESGDQQRPDQDLRVNGRSSVVTTVVVFEWFNQLLEVELLVNLNEQVLLIDEVSESPAGELEQRGVSAEAVQWIEYRNPS